MQYLIDLIDWHYYTGYRKQNSDIKWEELSLEWQDGQLIKAKIETIIKGNKESIKILPKKILPILQRIYQEQMAGTGKLHEYVFLRRNKKAGDCRKSLNTALTKAGLKVKGVGFHSFRHSFCTKIAKAEDIPFYVAHSAMEHEDMRTTKKYVHIQTEEIAKYIDKVQNKTS